MSCVESFFLVGCKDKMATMPADIAKPTLKAGLLILPVL